MPNKCKALCLFIGRIFFSKLYPYFGALWLTSCWAVVVVCCLCGGVVVCCLCGGGVLCVCVV